MSLYLCKDRILVIILKKDKIYTIMKEHRLFLKKWHLQLGFMNKTIMIFLKNYYNIKKLIPNFSQISKQLDLIQVNNALKIYINQNLKKQNQILLITQLQQLNLHLKFNQNIKLIFLDQALEIKIRDLKIIKKLVVRFQGQDNIMIHIKIYGIKNLIILNLQESNEKKKLILFF